MKILIVRNDISDQGIFGHLSLDLSPFECVTLENHRLNIEAGSYQVILDYSPHLKYITPHIKVPARDNAAGGDAGIRIHILNYEFQSDGCIGVGVRRSGFSVESSKLAFEGLMKILTKDPEGLLLCIK